MHSSETYFKVLLFLTLSCRTSPIVLILTGFVNHTSNRKTGYLLQSWIIQQNVVPTDAAKKGFEKGICGDCPLKLSQTGACFVNLLPVNNIYRTYFAGNYPKLSANEIEILKRYRYPIRIGSYGDPTAIPFDVWEPIIRASSGHTGYTHRWDSNECDERWNKYLMASVQSESEARIAQNLGWRTFRIIAPDAPLSENEILCRNTEDDTVRCSNCMLCDGKSNKPNIADRVHGLNWKISNFVKYSESNGTKKSRKPRRSKGAEEPRRRGEIGNLCKIIPHLLTVHFPQHLSTSAPQPSGIITVPTF